MEAKRSSFTGKLGFVLAAAGSAVGLGNIWRFPYLAAKYGGGIFLLVYLILAVTFGFALMCAEIAIGRKTGKSAIGAFAALDKRFKFLGWMASVVPLIILPYYSVIGGWVMKYIAVFATGNAGNYANDYSFALFRAETAEPVLWFALFIGLTALVVLFGVDKGIEKISKIMMPILVVLSIAVAIYSMTLDGAMEGVKYYLLPDFSQFSFMTVLSAMGQLFYSMSLAMGIMITYGSYMKKDVNLESSVHQIEIFDTGIAFMAGMMIIPAVFAFSHGDQEILNKSLTQGPGLMFDVLPKVFNSMPGGTIFGVLFFVLVFFAAITSSISLMETVVSIVQDKLGWGRVKACLVVIAASLLIGLPSAWGFGLLDGVKLLGMNFLSFFDFISNSILMPVVALLTCLFVGYVVKPKTVTDEIERTGKFKSKLLFHVVIKYLAPICIVLILGFSLLEAVGIITV